jgi:hypothetical protein
MPVFTNWEHTEHLMHKVRNVFRRGYLLKVYNSEKLLKVRFKTGVNIENDKIDWIHPVGYAANVKPSEKHEIIACDIGADPSRRVCLAVMGDRDKHPHVDENESVQYSPDDPKKFMRVRQDGGINQNSDDKQFQEATQVQHSLTAGAHKQDVPIHHFKGIFQIEGQLRLKGQALKTPGPMWMPLPKIQPLNSGTWPASSDTGSGGGNGKAPAIAENRVIPRGPDPVPGSVRFLHERGLLMDDSSEWPPDTPPLPDGPYDPPLPPEESFDINPDTWGMNVDDKGNVSFTQGVKFPDGQVIDAPGFHQDPNGDMTFLQQVHFTYKPTGLGNLDSLQGVSTLNSMYWLAPSPPPPPDVVPPDPDPGVWKPVIIGPNLTWSPPGTLDAVVSPGDVSDAVAAGTAGLAPINDPHFTGIPTAPNPGLNDDSTQLATTHWVRFHGNGLAASRMTVDDSGTVHIDGNVTIDGDLVVTGTIRARRFIEA